jgi:GNAT superfamily N-acetyltransferase
LTGIFGFVENIDRLEIDVHYYEVNPEEIYLHVQYKDISLSRVIDVEQKLIKNSSFVIDEENQNNGIGTQILLSQIRNARNLGYKKLEVMAVDGGVHRQNKGYLEFVGYHVWAKFGFTMDQPSELKFREILNASPYTDRFVNLYEMVQDEQGLKYWKKHGKRWNGEYDLAPNSINDFMNHFYISKRCQAARQIDHAFMQDQMP